MFPFIGFFKEVIDEAITACDFAFLMPEAFKEVLVFEIVFCNKDGNRLTATNTCIAMNENMLKVFGVKVFIKKVNEFLGLFFSEHIRWFATERYVANVIKEEPANVNVVWVGEVVDTLFKGFELAIKVVNSDKKGWFFGFIVLDELFRDGLTRSIGVEMFVHRLFPFWVLK